MWVRPPHVFLTRALVKLVYTAIVEQNVSDFFIWDCGATARKYFNVSDSAIGKWIRKYKITR